MAIRPVFVPNLSGYPLVRRYDVEFTWYPGMSIQQKQRSIQALHDAIRKMLGAPQVLEISTKSRDRLGVALSAFNLSLRDIELGRPVTIECAYQGSKVFERGGPFTDLYWTSSRNAKLDPRLTSSGDLIGFSFQGESWPLLPSTAFYDWLYIHGLVANPDLAKEMTLFSAFTDIEFNPKKAYSCQAGSAALYLSLARRAELDQALTSQASFTAALHSRDQPLASQMTSFSQTQLMHDTDAIE